MKKCSSLIIIGLLAILSGTNACKTIHFGKQNPAAYGGSFPDKSINSVEKQSTESLSEKSNEVVIPTSSQSLEQKPGDTKFSAGERVRAIKLIRQWHKHPLTDSTVAPSPVEKPMEPTARIGFWLVIGGLIGSFIPYLNILAFPAMLAGFILGIIALSKINKSNGELRGKGKAIASIVIPIVLLLITIVFIAIFFALIFAL